MFQVINNDCVALINENANNEACIVLNTYIDDAPVKAEASFYHIPLLECRGIKNKNLFRVKFHKDYLSRMEEIIKMFVL